MYNNVKRYETILNGDKYRSGKKKGDPTSPFSAGSSSSASVSISHRRSTSFGDSGEELEQDEQSKQGDWLKKMQCLQNRKQCLMKSLPSNLLQRLPVDLFDARPGGPGQDKALGGGGSSPSSHSEDDLGGLTLQQMYGGGGAAPGQMRLRDKFRTRQLQETRKAIYGRLQQLEKSDKAQLAQWDTKCRHIKDNLISEFQKEHSDKSLSRKGPLLPVARCAACRHEEDDGVLPSIGDKK
eukprot:RCo005432